MIRNDAKIRQICTLFIAFLPLVKIVGAPAVFSGMCGEKLWISAAILLALDFLLIFLFMFYARRFEGVAFFDILSDGYGKVFAKAVFFVYGIFFLLKAFVPLCEYKYLVESGFYEVMPRSEIFFPMFALTFYISIKGLKVFARCSEFVAPITVVGLFVLFYLTVGSCDFANLLPLFYGTGQKEANCVYRNLFWFNDCSYLLLFCGHFKPEKKMTLRVCLSYIAPALATVFFFVCFYAVFYTVSPLEKTAINAVSIFSVTLVNVGRFDYLALFLLVLSGVFALSLPVLAATKCFFRAFGATKSTVPAIVVNGLLLAAVGTYSSKIDAVIEFFQAYLAPFFWVCGYGLPLLGLKNCIFKQKKPIEPAVKNSAVKPSAAKNLAVNKAETNKPETNKSIANKAVADKGEANKAEKQKGEKAKTSASKKRYAGGKAR